MITLGTGVTDARHAKSVFWPYKFVGAELHVVWMESEFLARYIGGIRCAVDEAPMAKALRKGSPPHLGTTCFHKNRGNKASDAHKQKGRVIRTCFIFHLNKKCSLYHQLQSGHRQRVETGDFILSPHLVSGVLKERKSTDATHIDWLIMID